MSNKTILAAEARAQAGKGAARAVRRSGKIPAVIYGDNKEPVLISLAEKDLTMALGKKGFLTRLCELTVDGKPMLTVPRDVQLNPVSDRPEHADFLRVTDKTVIRVYVPIRVENEKASPGIAKGGVINLVHHEIEVFCRATDIPSEFVADLTGLDVGQSLPIEKLNMAKGVKPVLPESHTIVTLVAPSAMKAEEETAATPAAAAAAPAADAKAAPAKAAAPAKDAKKK